MRKHVRALSTYVPMAPSNNNDSASGCGDAVQFIHKVFFIWHMFTALHRPGYDRHKLKNAEGKKTIATVNDFVFPYERDEKMTLRLLHSNNRSLILGQFDKFLHLRV